MAAIQGGAPRVEPSLKGAWRLFLDAMRASLSRVLSGVLSGAPLRGIARLRQPLAALALVAIGFFAARLLDTAAPSATDDAYSTVRSVQPDHAGGVAIS